MTVGRRSSAITRAHPLCDDGQDERERGSGAGGRGDVDAPAVRVRHLLGDGEAGAGPARIPRASGIGPVERFEDVREILRRDLQP